MRLTFEDQKTYTISIDPNLPETYALLANIRPDFDCDPSITGLGLVLEEEIGESSSFWENIRSLLEKSLTGLTLNQFRVAIKSMDEAQDLTPIFGMPFFKDVQRLCIDGTLTQNCINFLTKTSFSRLKQAELTTLGLNTKSATQLIRTLSNSLVEDLDLDWNVIEADGSNDFSDFCFAIQTSTLSSLKINYIRDMEAPILAEHINQISRPFKLTIGGTLGLTDAGLNVLADLLVKHQDLQIFNDDDLMFVKPEPATTLLLETNAGRKVPTLFSLAANVASLALTKVNNPGEIVEGLSTEFVEILPLTNQNIYLAQYQAAANRREKLKKLFADNPDGSSPDFKSKIDEITTDYSIELRASFSKLTVS